MNETVIQQEIIRYTKFLEKEKKDINPFRIAKKFKCDIDYVLDVLFTIGKGFSIITAYDDGIYKGTRFYEIKNLDKSTIEQLYKNMGLGMIDPSYVEINDLQDKDYEYSKIKKFLHKYINLYAMKNNLKKEDMKINFINYGKTELVYVLTEPKGKRVTLLVKQPGVKLGEVKKEATNLLELNKKDNMVIAPIDYYEYGDYELYTTPYINQARCIASLNSWGMYVPEPEYRFERFSKEQEKIVTTCMIAKLVSLYDFDNNEGICECKLGGGDFMLPKGWELESPTIENTLNNLYLIAAREKIKCPFEDYLDIIRREFSQITINKNQNDFFVNKRARASINLEDIDNGIELGKEIIKNRQALGLVKVITRKINNK